MLKKIFFGIILAALAVGVPLPAKADPTGTFQRPCYPADAADYSFWQYISGWGHHIGDDICHQAGIPVFSTANGVVVYSARTPDSYRWGNLIIIQHNVGSGQVVSLYGHLGDNRQVAAGQVVSKGQLIGFVGPEGPQNGYWGPHTHFGIHGGPYGAPVGSYADWVHGYDPPPSSNWTDSVAFANAHRMAYDYLSGEEDSSPSMYYNDGMDVTIKLWNTGSQTWRAGGTNPTRLGTSNPFDRASAFSQNGTATGWVAANRVKLEADTPPDGLGTFHFRLESNQHPGTYDEAFTPVVEGNQWMSGPQIHIRFTLQPPGWRGQWVNQLVSKTSDPTDLSNDGSTENLVPGQQMNLKVLIKNTGELPWDAAGSNPTRFGTARPNDRSSGFATLSDNAIPASENWVSLSRASGLDGRYDPGTNTVVADSQITNGEIGVFSYTATVPDVAGYFREYFNPVVEGKTWMPDEGIWFGFNVAYPGYHYRYSAQTQTTTQFGSGVDTADATLRLTNTGREPWPVGTTFRVGTANPRDNHSRFVTPSGTGAWVSDTRPATLGQNISVNGKSTVDTGEVGAFSFRITVPENTSLGNYRLYVRPVYDGVAWLPEDYGIFFPVNVTARPYDYQFMKQTYSGDPNNFTHGSTMTAKVALKNTGRTPWPVSGSGAVRLGTSHPNDRSSGFATLGGTDPWASTSRASSIDGKVTDLSTLATTTATQINPGETALFSFPLTAGPPAGFYKEYFNLVAEGVTWLPDYGVYLPLNVK